MNEAQATADYAAFTAPDPVFAAEARKEQEKAKAEAAKKAALPKGTKKEVEKMMEKPNLDKEATEKSKLLQQINDYMKHIKEYFPDRLEFIRVPKTVGPKNTVEELRVYVKDLENELGKKGALEVVKGIWVKGFEALEQISSSGRFGLNLQGIGAIAQNTVANRIVQGETIPGPAVPTLAEFSIKYSSWFSTSVEARLVMLVFEMVTGVHRMNSTQPESVKKAATKPASKETTDLMKDL